MQVTANTQTAKGQRYELSNGDALLMKEMKAPSGKVIIEPVYVFSNGRTYSARSGRFAATTIAPAMAALRRYQA